MVGLLGDGSEINWSHICRVHCTMPTHAHYAYNARTHSLTWHCLLRDCWMSLMANPSAQCPRAVDPLLSDNVQQLPAKLRCKRRVTKDADEVIRILGFESLGQACGPITTTSCASATSPRCPWRHPREDKVISGPVIKHCLEGITWGLPRKRGRNNSGGVS